MPAHLTGGPGAPPPTWRSSMHAQRSTLALALAVAGLAGLVVLGLPAVPAFAHGGLTYPATRTYACYLDGKAGGLGGDLDPTNPACRAAVEAGGKTPLWNWFGNLISDAGGRHREIIPDGELCGPTSTYAPYNAARTDWPTTRLTPGSTITVRYNAWAPHPGTWRQYVTRDGWDPAQPLRWSDLELFDEVTNPPINSSGPDGAEYSWRSTLPERRGRHLIYSIWQRSDSPEAFYNCADVHFGEGPISHEVGAPPATPAPAPTATPGPTPTPTPTAAPTPAPSPTPGPGAGTGSLRCEVDWETHAQWADGFVTGVTVRNTGDTAIRGWTLDFALIDGQRVTNAWSTDLAQHHGHVEARNLAWNETIAPGQSVSFGFQGTHTGQNRVPALLRLNGSLCDA